MNSQQIIVHIVDDEEAVRNSLVFLLASSGLAARAHSSASAFLEVAPSLKSGCLITDLRMPDMDGVELLRRLREIDALLPAIVITGHGDVQMAVEAMKNGASTSSRSRSATRCCSNPFAGWWTWLRPRLAARPQSMLSASGWRRYPTVKARFFRASWRDNPTRPSPMNWGSVRGR